MKILLLVLFAFSGCARLSSRQTETQLLVGTNIVTTRITKLTVTTLWDAHSEVAKLRSTTTDKTQGLTVGGLVEGSSGTNTVQALKHLDSILSR